ncbi:UL16-binding protein 2-like [Meles meles]|uniref:UL16-binding protein 2-like n=1 Tax=Meles meles TaxID=9662 RepID=UPI001E69FDFB|nr:UL16-binding protein 2-like [Meles meles]
MILNSPWSGFGVCPHPVPTCPSSSGVAPSLPFIFLQSCILTVLGHAGLLCYGQAGVSLDWVDPNLHLCFPFADAVLLSYRFFITSQARPGQPWCEIQGQINGKTFLSYDCQSKQFKPIGPWGMKLKDTAFWQKQEETLKLLVEELRKKLLDIKAENFTNSGSLTMQGRLMCERGADGHTRESWQFGFNEQITPLFELENRKWTVVPPGGQQFKGTLDNDRELTKLLVRTSNGDCKSWLQQVREHRDETQETTGAPVTTLSVALVKGTATRLITSVFLVVLTQSILLVVQGIVL